MKRVDLNTLSASFFVVIAAGNFANIIISKAQLSDLFVWVLPFLLLSAAICFLKNKITPKTTAIVFILFSFGSIYFGNLGNLTGAVFLCFALYIFANTKVSVVAGVVSVLLILTKAIADEWSVPEVINYLSAYAYIISVYWVMIHPKPLVFPVSGLDYETGRVINMVANGMTYKEIADRLSISDSAVSKRLERCRIRFDAKSNEHLVILLIKNGHIDLN